MEQGNKAETNPANVRICRIVITFDCCCKMTNNILDRTITRASGDGETPYVEPKTHIWLWHSLKRRCTGPRGPLYIHNAT